MKKNKEIKKGDKIWLNSVYLSYASHHIVKSVKKKGTLVEVLSMQNYTTRSMRLLCTDMPPVASSQAMTDDLVIRMRATLVIMPL